MGEVAGRVVGVRRLSSWRRWKEARCWGYVGSGAGAEPLKKDLSALDFERLRGVSSLESGESELNCGSGEP